MTIVAGFANNNGAVLAADSQEIISDYAKGSTHKIKLVVCGYEWSIGISGAADDTAYFELFEDELSEALLPLDTYDYDKMVSIIKAVLHKLHKQHIWSQKDRKSPFQALIVTQCVAKPTNPRSLIPHLLEIKDSAVIPVRGFRSIGVGTYMAKYLENKFLDNHDTLNCSLEHLGDILILIIKEIKKAIVGCDGQTSVALFYDDGRFRWMTTPEVKEVETLSEQLERLSVQSLLSLTNHDITGEEFSKSTAVASTETLKLLRKRETLAAKRKKVLDSLPVYRGKKSSFFGSQVG